MTKTPKINPSEILLSINEFQNFYNSNVPESFPRVTLSNLHQFKSEHQSLFKDGDRWTTDRHRKHVIDWLRTRAE